MFVAIKQSLQLMSFYTLIIGFVLEKKYLQAPNHMHNTFTATSAVW